MLITLLILNLLATVGAFGALAARLGAVEEKTDCCRDEVAGLAQDTDSSDQLTLECDALHARIDLIDKKLPEPKPRKPRGSNSSTPTAPTSETAVEGSGRGTLQ